MVIVIDRSNRERHGALLDQMHRTRKRVFVDTLHWNVPIIDGQFEIDQFDTDDAVYLVVPDRRTGAHAGSVRLLPSIAPHLLGDLFPQLCETTPPRDARVWEVSRQCYDPDLPRDQLMRARHYITSGLLEYGIRQGITRYTCIMNVEHIPMLLSPGWNCTPLGMPQNMHNEVIAAMAIHVSQPTLDDIRTRFGGRYPVLQDVVQSASAA